MMRIKKEKNLTTPLFVQCLVKWHPEHFFSAGNNTVNSRENINIDKDITDNSGEGFFFNGHKRVGTS